MDPDKSRLISRTIKRGAKLVELDKLFEQCQIVWRIQGDDRLSETCISLEELVANAARNAQNAIGVMKRMEQVSDHDLMTALKKYVEDACQSLKDADNILKKKRSSLAGLFVEIPEEAEGRASWRNLIRRRDVIAHNLLTIDNDKVHEEARRDFSRLHALLSHIHFVPTVSHEGKMISPILKTEALRNLDPVTEMDSFKPGESLVFIYEDDAENISSFRMGRSKKNKLLVASSRHGKFNLSIWGIK